ncbi:PREDICTED: uncharacterized protein LOC105556207 [Vollenhovia emeryi]|uniref:uncharacterized protein LOC105556207 n=1 Tax=Vollenhovia emeryi TaxID=411798 RepID=UPI0005F36136|nr:PREDICTED: uncharacterized protein LOC105556207 [Vollenhovia emeryi]
MIKRDEKEKAKNIIFNHIMKNPKAKATEIHALLKHRHKITVNSQSVSKWLIEARRREGIPFRRMIKRDKKEKAKNIIFNHIMKNPNAKATEIHAALKYRHKITVNFGSVSKWLNEAKKREEQARPMIQSDVRKKANSIIFDNLRKEPTARISDIHATLKEHYKIIVSLSTVRRWTKEIMKR